MEQKKFETYLAAAASVDSEYSRGYKKGLRRFYYGDNYEPEGGHLKWLALDGNRIEIGEGYRDGHKGLPPRGFHGGIGNMNAAGALPANTQMHIRLNMQVKARYVKAAQKEGLKLSEWVLKKLDEKCEENEYDL